MASEGLLKRETKVKYVEDDVCDDTLVIDQMFTQWRGQSEYHRSLFREKLGILWWDQHSPNVWWDQHSPNVVTGFHLFLLLWIMKAWLPDKAEVSFLCRLLLIFHVLDCLESLSHHWAPFLARILLTNLLLNYIGTTRTHCSEVAIAGIQRSFTPSGCFTLQLFSKLNDHWQCQSAQRKLANVFIKPIQLIFIIDPSWLLHPCYNFLPNTLMIVRMVCRSASSLTTQPSLILTSCCFTHSFASYLLQKFLLKVLLSLILVTTQNTILAFFR